MNRYVQRVRIEDEDAERELKDVQPTIDDLFNDDPEEPGRLEGAFKKALVQPRIDSDDDTKRFLEEMEKVSKKAPDKALVGEEGVDHPPHYAAIGKYEPIDVIEDWSLNYHAGCALKYIARYLHKGTPIKDLKKAAWYLLRLADEMEKTSGVEKE